MAAVQGLNLGAVGAETDRRGFIPVDEKMRVLGTDGQPVPHLYCIGDANGGCLLRALRGRQRQIMCSRGWPAVRAAHRQTGSAPPLGRGDAHVGRLLQQPSECQMQLLPAVHAAATAGSQWAALSRGCAGKYMLAHAASAQGISAVENICDREHVLNHLSVPAACFTHPEVRHSAPGMRRCGRTCRDGECAAACCSVRCQVGRQGQAGSPATCPSQPPASRTQRWVPQRAQHAGMLGRQASRALQRACGMGCRICCLTCAAGGHPQRSNLPTRLPIWLPEPR